jgi:radical SAM superfamily enzyme YgiQ (UPF0313 family)
VNVLLISTYELGHSPFGLASPKAWLARAGHRVECADLAVTRLPEEAVKQADLIAFYLPMHTATRLAVPVIEKIKRLNPSARLACYGLYAPLNRDLLRGLGVETLIGGEFEPALVRLAAGEAVPDISIPVDRLEFVTPDRTGMPDNAAYAKLRQNGSSKIVAYTEASRGCKHVCRHCPVTPVYNGQFRIIQRGVVLEDIRRQVASGAAHVTFGDPDFFNGPLHALRIVEQLHAEFPQVTYDATIKIEHLIRHREHLLALHDTGCLFVTSAVESLDDVVLEKLEKNHTRADFLEAVDLTRRAGLTLQPTFIAFTPWTTIEGYRDLLEWLARLELVENVSPVQLALCLLVTSGSRLLELEDVRATLGPYDPKLLVYPWKHPDPQVEELGARAFRLVQNRQKEARPRTEIFRELYELAGGSRLPDFGKTPEAAMPHLDEPWYCCAEPTEDQLAHL